MTAGIITNKRRRRCFLHGNNPLPPVRKTKTGSDLRSEPTPQHASPLNSPQATLKLMFCALLLDYLMLFHVIVSCGRLSAYAAFITVWGGYVIKYQLPSCQMKSRFVLLLILHTHRYLSFVFSSSFLVSPQVMCCTSTITTAS